MHNKEYYENLADIEKSGISREDIDKTYDDLSAIHKKCLEKSDDITESVFKTFVLTGTVAETKKSLHLSYSNGEDFVRYTIVFCRLPDKELTLFVKTLYARKAKILDDFLKEQIPRLIEDYDYDIFEHFAEYLAEDKDNSLVRHNDIYHIRKTLGI